MAKDGLSGVLAGPLQPWAGVFPRPPAHSKAGLSVHTSLCSHSLFAKGNGETQDVFWDCRVPDSEMPLMREKQLQFWRELMG